MAEVEQQREAVEQAKQAVVIAGRYLQVAASEITEAQAEVERYQAATTRWKAEYLRLAELAREKAVDIRVVQEAEQHYRSEQSSERASKVQVVTKQTQRLAAEAEVDKAKVNVMAAQAAVQVAEATAARYAALLDYTRITAPYDGVVTARNVSVGDLVRPGTGEGSQTGGPLADASKAVPLFVVARMDKLMFVVGVPETDAGVVSVGTPVSIRVQASGVPEIETTVSRISWSVSAQTRTLAAQIDLPNPNGQLMPGMYASGTLKITRRGVLAVPPSAIVAQGNQVTCFFVVDRRAVQQAVETGLSNDTWVQLLRKRVESGHEQGQWTAVSPADQVVFRDVSEVTDGASVEAIPDPGQGQHRAGAAPGND
jgi:multidrug efflux pump subunit AcrA (membrane-fusion protein)